MAEQHFLQPLPSDLDLGAALQALALAHFRSWMQERGQTSPGDETGETTDLPLVIPSHEALQKTRNHIFVWKQLNRLPDPGRAYVRMSIGQELHDADIAVQLHRSESYFLVNKAAWYQSFRSDLRLANIPGQPEWPDWVISALRDTAGSDRWRQIQAADNRQDPSYLPASGNGNRIARNVFIALLLLTLGYGSWTYFNRPKDAEEVFVENFDPPSSMLSDFNARYAASEDGKVHLVRCEELLTQADAYYQANDYSVARSILEDILDSGESDCSSDVLYYLGIVCLKEEEPGIALMYFSKIDDLESFGEEIYWYQALCFVKVATYRPDLRDKASRAVERFIAQTTNEDRRELAQKMLDDLRK
ncbi:MAG: hypothetical protein IPL65_00135 [Lewinellaceae bacterium]|nr:hypothetical protein [Lewinellaceae bacterium]